MYVLSENIKRIEIFTLKFFNICFSKIHGHVFVLVNKDLSENVALFKNRRSLLLVAFPTFIYFSPLVLMLVQKGHIWSRALCKSTHIRICSTYIRNYTLEMNHINSDSSSCNTIII